MASMANRAIEILDFGYPQNTETDTLKMYITTEGVKSERAMVCRLLAVVAVEVAGSSIGRSMAKSHTGGLFQDHNAGYRCAVVAAS